MIIDAVQFTYTPDITAINQEQFSQHIKLYEDYVNQTNQISDLLTRESSNEIKAKELGNTVFRGIKKDETFSLNGIMLHELYFRNMGGVLGEPDLNVGKFLEEQFGSIQNWAEDFVNTALISRGWTILCFEQRTHSLRNISLDTHDQGMVALVLPLIVLDMYEHAYMIQYGSEKQNYIKAFMENIHWEIVSQRMRLWGLNE